MARISRVGLGWTAIERIDWYASLEEWYNAENSNDYGSQIEAVCKGDCTNDVNGADFTNDSVHGAWAYADPSVYYDFTNEDIIPTLNADTVINAFDVRISGMFLKTNGVSSGFEPITVNNKRSLLEDCRILAVNPAGTSYGVQINGAGSQANQDVFLRCVISRVNAANTSELVKQAVANGYGALRNCVLIAGAGKYADGSNNVGLEITDTVGIGPVGYDATSILMNTSSSEDSSGSSGLTLIDETAFADFAANDFRSKAGGALDVVGTNTPYIGVGLDVVVGDGITLTPFNTNGVRHTFNRNVNDNDLTISTKVNLTGDPSGGIEWRLVNAADDLPLSGFDWKEYLPNGATTGSKTVNITAPTSHGRIWYKLELRFKNDHGVTAKSDKEFCVGLIVVDNGQSSSQYRIDKSLSPPTIHPDATYCTTAGWQSVFSLGNGAIKKTNDLIALLDIPVGYFNNGSLSKNMDYFVTGTGWVNLSMVLSSYLNDHFELMTFDQGEANALLGTTALNYQAGHQTLYDKLLLQMGKTQGDFVFQVNLGGNSNNYNTGTYTDQSLEAVRKGKRDFVEANSGAIWGGHRINIPLGDTIHNTATGYQIAAEREVKSFSKHLGLSAFSGDGRSISSSELSGSTLTLHYTAGEPLTKIGAGASTITDVSEDDFATTINILSTVVNDDSVVHTLETSPSSEVRVREYYGINIDISVRAENVFPSSSITSVNSNFNLEVKNIPNGTYLVVLDDESGNRVSRETINFTGGFMNKIFALPAGTRLKGYVEDSVTPSVKGCYIEGVTA